MVAGYMALLALFGAERIAELLLSRRNARTALARSGVESGAAQFRWMATVHTLFLPCCAAEVLVLHRPFPGALGWSCAAAALCAQGLRWWAISALGWRWNVRVIVVPGDAPVRRGPYRFLRHPNYVAVAAEMLFLPLAHGAWMAALVFSALNGLLLRARIRTEEQALGAAWEREFAGVPRFIPHG
jgi:methyltransferase